MTSDICLDFGSDRDHDGVQEFLKGIFLPLHDRGNCRNLALPKICGLPRVYSLYSFCTLSGLLYKNISLQFYRFTALKLQGHWKNAVRPYNGNNPQPE